MGHSKKKLDFKCKIFSLFIQCRQFGKFIYRISLGVVLCANINNKLWSSQESMTKVTVSCRIDENLFAAAVWNWESWQISLPTNVKVWAATRMATTSTTFDMFAAICARIMTKKFSNTLSRVQNFNLLYALVLWQK